MDIISPTTDISKISSSLTLGLVSVPFSKTLSFLINCDKSILTDSKLQIELTVEIYDGKTWKHDVSMIFKGIPTLPNDGLGGIILPSLSVPCKWYKSKTFRVRISSNLPIMSGVKCLSQ